MTHRATLFGSAFRLTTFQRPLSINAIPWQTVAPENLRPSVKSIDHTTTCPRTATFLLTIWLTARRIESQSLNAELCESRVTLKHAPPLRGGLLLPRTLRELRSKSPLHTVATQLMSLARTPKWCRHPQKNKLEIRMSWAILLQGIVQRHKSA